MSDHRCAVCGSVNVVLDTQSAGLSYNVTKGAIGNAVLGVGGAFLGFENKEQQVYICRDCGITLTYCMPEDLKAVIDACLISKELRSRLTLHGHSINWDYIRSTYKNIEEGVADRLSAAKEQINSNSLLSYATATEEEFVKAASTVRHFTKKLNGSSKKDSYSDENPMKLEEYLIWQNAVAVFIENAAKYYMPKHSYDSSVLPPQELAQLFAVYLFEKIRLTLGHDPEFVLEEEGFVCKDFELYAKMYPFVLLFADKFFKLKKVTTNPLVDVKAHEESDHFWTAEQFGRMFVDEARVECDENFNFYHFRENFSNDYGTLESLVLGGVSRMFWVGTIRFDQLKMVHFFPRYILRNGKLYHAQCTHSPCSFLSLKDLSDFFAAYPQKEAVYTKRLAEIEALKRKLNANTDERNHLSEQMSTNDKMLSYMKAEIAKLSKKLFGKQKAQEKIQELNEKMEKLRNENKTVQSRIEEIDTESADISLEDEYRDLLCYMEHFLILRPCEP